MADPDMKMDPIPEQPTAQEAMMALIAREPPRLVDMNMDLYTAETHMSGMTLDTPRNAGDIEEIARLNTELLRLRADSVAEQDVIDTILHELTTAKDELTSTKDLLEKKTSECIDLRASVEKQKRQYESLQKQVLGQPAAVVTAMPVQDSEIRLLRLQIANLTADVSDKDARLKTATARLEKERKEWSWQSAQLSTAQRDRDHLRAEYQSAAEANQKMAQEMNAIKEQDVRVREANAESAAHSDKKVRELQELVQFFKCNSERLAKETRQLGDQNRELNEKNTVKDRELDNKRSANLALKMQAGVV